MFTPELSKTIDKTVGKLNDDISSLSQRRARAINIFEEAKDELSTVNDEISKKLSVLDGLSGQIRGMRASLEDVANKNNRTIDQLTSLLEG